MNLRKLIFTALLTAIICIFAPFSVYLGVIPLSLTTFAVYITSSVADTKTGCVSVILYIILGAFGLPVFSGFTGGFQKIIGATGGYIIGYIPGSFVIGTVINKFKFSDKLKFPLAMAAGTAVWYTFGTAWYVYISGVSLGKAIYACVIPFILPDLIKIAAASALSVNLRKYLGKHHSI